MPHIGGHRASGGYSAGLEPTPMRETALWRSVVNNSTFPPFYLYVTNSRLTTIEFTEIETCDVER